MKRFFSLLLALVMTLGLASPALAAEKTYDDGYYEGYDIGFAEGEAQAIIDKEKGTFAPKYHYDVFTQEEAGWETYEDGYENGLKYGYWRGYSDYYYKGEYDSGHALGVEQAEADFAANTTRDDLQEYPDDTAFSSDEAYRFEKGRYEGYWNTYSWLEAEATWAEWEEIEAENRKTEIASAGGVYGQINVMLNGSCIQFPDAVPEQKDDRTMVPLRAICEAMGATVEFLDGDVVQITLNGRVLRHVIGADTVTATGEETETIKMDCVSYASADRTYVPVRFFAEALGLEVYWDEDYEAVVLLDRQKLIDEIDQDFTVYGQIMANQVEQQQQQNQRGTETVEATLVMLDSISGDKSYSISGDFVTATGGGAMTLEGSFNLAGLVSLLQDQGWVYEEDAAMAATLSKTQSFQLKMSPQGETYLQMPLMAQMMRESGALPVGTKDSVWFLIAEAVEGNETLLQEVPGMGAMLAESSAYMLEYGSAFDYWGDTQELAGYMASLIGDDCFVKNGNRYTYHLDRTGLIGLLGVTSAEDIAYLEQVFPSFDIKINYDVKSGAYDAAVDIRVDLDAPYGYIGNNLVVVNFSSKGDSKGGESTLTIQKKNSFNFTMTDKTSITQTNSVPDYKLPQDANLLPQGSELPPQWATLVGSLVREIPPVKAVEGTVTALLDRVQ